MKPRQLLQYMRSRYVDPKYAFKDRLYFLFGSVGAASACAAFVAALASRLPVIAAIASLASCVLMLGLMAVSFCMENIALNRLICSVFLNLVMFPALFWFTGGVDCGMVLYFILGLCVATLILEGRQRTVVLVLSLVMQGLCLYFGFRFPTLAYTLSYEERGADMISSFFIVALFVITVIIMMMREYQREHAQVLASAATLERQANTDNLTGLHNQRYLIEALHGAIEPDPKGRAVSILLLDVDNFKGINDTFGHLRGNEVLRQFALLLLGWESEDLVAGRYGGEEFLLLMRGYDLEQAVEAGERIREEVCQDPVLQELAHGRFSVSGGVAQWDGAQTIDDWIRQADERLYAAKAAGKNRIQG